MPLSRIEHNTTQGIAPLSSNKVDDTRRVTLLVNWWKVLPRPVSYGGVTIVWRGCREDAWYYAHIPPYLLNFLFLPKLAKLCGSGWRWNKKWELSGFLSILVLDVELDFSLLSLLYVFTNAEHDVYAHFTRYWTNRSYLLKNPFVYPPNLLLCLLMHRWRYIQDASPLIHLQI